MDRSLVAKDPLKVTADLALLLMKEGMELAAGEKNDFEVQLRVVGDLFLASKDPLFYKNMTCFW